MPDPVSPVLGLNENNDDRTVPVWFDEFTRDALSGLARNYRPRDLNQAAAAYKDVFQSYYPQSRANEVADFYGARTKEIINDPNTFLSDYEKIRSGNLSSLGSVFKDVLDYGLANEKARLASGGYGNSGPSSYDRILSSTRTASNLTPVLNQIYGNLGREATASYGSREDHNRYLLNLFASDPFGRYASQAARTAINPYLQKLGLTDYAVSGLGDLVGAVRSNLSGYENIKGLTSRMSDINNDIWAGLTGGLYGQAYGSQPGQDQATAMGLIGTAASIYGGSNQYRPPDQSGAGGANAGSGTTWQSAYGNYNPQQNYVQQYPTGGYNYGMSYGGQPQSDPQSEYYRQLLSQGGLLSSGGYGAGMRY